MLENDILLQYYHIEKNTNEPLFKVGDHTYLFMYCPYEEEQFKILYQNYLYALSSIHKHGFKLVINQYQQVLSCHYVLFEINEEDYSYWDIFKLNKQLAKPISINMKQELSKMTQQLHSIRKNIDHIDINIYEEGYMITMYNLGLAENCISLIHSVLKEDQNFFIRQSYSHNDLTTMNYLSLFNPLNIVYKPIIYDLAHFYKNANITLEECIEGIQYLELNLHEMSYLFLMVSYPYEFFNELNSHHYKLDLIETSINDIILHQQRIKDLYRYLIKYIPHITIEWMLK